MYDILQCNFFPLSNLENSKKIHQLVNKCYIKLELIISFCWPRYDSERNDPQDGSGWTDPAPYPGQGQTEHQPGRGLWCSDQRQVLSGTRSSINRLGSLIRPLFWNSEVASSRLICFAGASYCDMGNRSFLVKNKIVLIMKIVCLCKITEKHEGAASPGSSIRLVVDC